MDWIRIGDRHIGQAIVAAFVRVGELSVIEAESVKERGVQIIDPHDLLDRTVAEVVRSAVHVAFFEPAAGHPQRKAMPVVIAAILALRNRQAAKYAGPEHDGFIEQPALLEV